MILTDQGLIRDSINFLPEGWGISLFSFFAVSSHRAIFFWNEEFVPYNLYNGIDGYINRFSGLFLSDSHL